MTKQEKSRRQEATAEFLRKISSASDAALQRERLMKAMESVEDDEVLITIHYTED